MIRFGIEEEFFVLQHDGQPASNALMDDVFRVLVAAGCSIQVQQANGQPLSVRWESGPHSAVIKTEYCTHVMELAFSPLHEPSEFVALWEQAFGLLRPILTIHGLRIVPGSVLPDPPLPILRPNESDPDGSRQQFLINRASTGSPLFVPHLFGVICSTQVSLDLDWNDVAPNLASYYAFEFLFPLCYSTGQRFGPHYAHAMRALLMQHNFGPEYGQAGFPTDLAATLAENARVEQNPSHRSYSYIARRPDRVEFRSADAQGDAQRVLEIVALRLQIHAAICQGFRDVNLIYSHAVFLDVIHNL